MIIFDIIDMHQNEGIDLLLPPPVIKKRKVVEEEHEDRKVQNLIPHGSIAEVITDLDNPSSDISYYDFIPFPTFFSSLFQPKLLLLVLQRCFTKLLEDVVSLGFKKGGIFRTLGLHEDGKSIRGCFPHDNNKVRRLHFLLFMAPISNNEEFSADELICSSRTQ